MIESLNYFGRTRSDPKDRLLTLFILILGTRFIRNSH
jgi:hypothetical protein